MAKLNSSPSKKYLQAARLEPYANQRLSHPRTSTANRVTSSTTNNHHSNTCENNIRVPLCQSVLFENESVSSSSDANWKRNARILHPQDFKRENIKLLFQESLLEDDTRSKSNMEYNLHYEPQRMPRLVQDGKHTFTQRSAFNIQVQNHNACAVRFCLLLKKTGSLAAEDNVVGQIDDESTTATPSPSFLTQVYPRQTTEQLSALDSDFVLLQPFQCLTLKISMAKIPQIGGMMPGDGIAFVAVLTALDSLKEMRAVIQTAKRARFHLEAATTGNHNDAAVSTLVNTTGPSLLDKPNYSSLSLHTSKSSERILDSPTTPQKNANNHLLLYSLIRMTYLTPLQKLLLDSGLPIVGFGQVNTTCAQ